MCRGGGWRCKIGAMKTYRADDVSREIFNLADETESVQIDEVSDKRWLFAVEMMVQANVAKLLAGTAKKVIAAYYAAMNDPENKCDELQFQAFEESGGLMPLEDLLKTFGESTEAK